MPEQVNLDWPKLRQGIPEDAEPTAVNQDESRYAVAWLIAARLPWLRKDHMHILQALSRSRMNLEISM
jgi:hypothetical protein